MLEKKNKSTQDIKDKYNKEAANVKIDVNSIKEALQIWGQIQPVLVDSNTGEIKPVAQKEELEEYGIDSGVPSTRHRESTGYIGKPSGR